MNSRWLIVPLTAFAITLAVFVGLKLSGESLALLTGVGLGGLASLPGYAILFRLANRKPSQSDALMPPAPPTRVEAVSPLLPASPPAPRRFIVIGADLFDFDSIPITSDSAGNQK